MRKTYIIVNPKAGGGRAKFEFQKIQEKLKGDSTIKAFFSDYAGHSIPLSKQAVLEGASKIISLGGDGTHFEVLNGMLEGVKELYKKDIQELSPSEKVNIPSLGIVSIGSGNDLKRTLKLPKDALSAFDIAFDGKNEKYLDIGQFEFIDFNGEKKTRYFMNILSGGFSGTVTLKANKSKSRYFGKFAYVYALLKTLIFSGVPDGFMLHENGKIEGKFFEFDISNGKYFGAGMLISPDSVMDDGYLNVSLFRNYTGIEVLFKIVKLYNGTIINEEKLFYEKTKDLFIECNPKAIIEADGEVVGYTPVKVKVLQNLVKVPVP